MRIGCKLDDENGVSDVKPTDDTTVFSGTAYIVHICLHYRSFARLSWSIPRYRLGLQQRLSLLCSAS
jgi:hypothetical protein